MCPRVWKAELLLLKTVAECPSKFCCMRLRLTTLCLAHQQWKVLTCTILCALPRRATLGTAPGPLHRACGACLCGEHMAPLSENLRVVGERPVIKLWQVPRPGHCLSLAVPRPRPPQNQGSPVLFISARYRRVT